MVSLSKRNKRTSLHQKYKVEKKVRQHHKKVKKSLKNVKPKQPRTILTQIPMEMPDKTRIIKELQQSQQQMKEAEKKRLLALSFLKKQQQTGVKVVDKSKLIKDSSRAFVSDIRKLIDDSDVVLVVLDARDPMGTRSLETEKMVKTAGKTLIFVLNKIDLVPIDNMRRWMEYLRREARVYPFKSNCQEQANRLGHSKGASVPSASSAGSSGASFGVDLLLNHLRAMRKASAGPQGPAEGAKSAHKLVVGVVGVPNTGKSSVVNSLKRRRICVAGNLAGLTRSLQRIAIDSHIDLIDSPGLVLAATADPTEYALRNCVRVESIDDPVTVAEAVLRRCGDLERLRHVYKLPALVPIDGGDGDGDDALTRFMLVFAQRVCPLRKGGRPDLTAAARRLIVDWNWGKIPYCSEPPARDSAGDRTEPAEVDIDEAELERFTLISGPIETVTVLTESRPIDDVVGDGDEEEMEEDDEEDDDEEEGDEDMEQ